MKASFIQIFAVFCDNQEQIVCVPIVLLIGVRFTTSFSHVWSELFHDAWDGGVLPNWNWPISVFNEFLHRAVKHSDLFCSPIQLTENCSSSTYSLLPFLQRRVSHLHEWCSIVHICASPPSWSYGVNVCDSSPHFFRAAHFRPDIDCLESFSTTIAEVSKSSSLPPWRTWRFLSGFVSILPSTCVSRCVFLAITRLTGCWRKTCGNTDERIKSGGRS